MKIWNWTSQINPVFVTFHVLISTFLRHLNVLNCIKFDINLNALIKLTLYFSAPERKLVQYQQAFNYQTRVWCWEPPSFRCWKTKVGYRPAYRNETQNVTKLIRECCAGYERIRTECQPICSPPCKNGRCIEPGNCKCELGFGGDACDHCKLLLLLFSFPFL